MTDKAASDTRGSRPRRTVRREFWEHASDIFHPEVLVATRASTADAIQHQQVVSLKFVFDVLGRVLFGAPATFHTNLRNPPAELLEDISFDNLLSQYACLRDEVIPELLNTPAGISCYRVFGVFVLLGDGSSVRVSTDSVSFLEECWHDRSWGEDHSILLGSHSAVGRKVQVKLGRVTQDGVLQGFDKKAREEGIYKMLMSLSYRAFVRPRRIWHILRLYHRVYMAGASTEALAELVGSMLTQRVQCQLGRHASLLDSIGATKLRCAGIRGDPRDIGFIERSLNIYFRGKPWHVLLNDRNRRERDKRFPGGLLGSSLVLHRHELSVRVRTSFSWVADSLVDVLDVFGRRHLRVEGGVASHETPKSGYVLRSASSLHDLTTILRDAQVRYEPNVVDPRVWEELCVYVCAFSRSVSCRRQSCPKPRVAPVVTRLFVLCVCAFLSPRAGFVSLSSAVVFVLTTACGQCPLRHDLSRHACLGTICLDTIVLIFWCSISHPFVCFVRLCVFDLACWICLDSVSGCICLDKSVVALSVGARFVLT